jgi:hypothetical protein
MRILLRPCPHFRSGVGGEIIQHHVNVLIDVRLHGFLEESQKVVAVTSWFALIEDLTGTHVQCREQVRRVVAHIIMSAFLGRIEPDRQHRLSPGPTPGPASSHPSIAPRPYPENQGKAQQYRRPRSSCRFCAHYEVSIQLSGMHYENVVGGRLNDPIRYRSRLWAPYRGSFRRESRSDF